jgi:hypothetical protein
LAKALGDLLVVRRYIVLRVFDADLLPDHKTPISPA